MIEGVQDDSAVHLPSGPGIAEPLPAADAPAALPAWGRRCALLIIAALAGLAYAWQLDRDPLEPYYAAAVRSMSGSWHDFIYGAFDPAGTVTLDKLPGAFWIQALSVRAFGYHPWAIVLPQAVEGVLTVLVLYRAVSRLSGPVAGLIAALVLAASPAVVALDRGNISDSLMILLLVIAADAVSAAIAVPDGPGEAGGPGGASTGRHAGRRAGRLRWARGPQARLVLAAVCVGLAFQAKMIEAWLVLPALCLAYLISGPGAGRRRVRELLVALVVTGVVSVAWMSAISLVPAASRPYVDGSQDNSVFAQVFSYNGFGRFDEQTPLTLLASEVARPGSESPLGYPAPGVTRMLHGTLGRDAGWLLPAAALVAVAGLIGRRRSPRRDPVRASLVLWAVWLATLWMTFSALTTINAYYTAALAPAAAAIIGTGVAMAWSGPGARSARGRRVVLAVVVAASTAYAAFLVPASGYRVPQWLLPAVIAVGLAAVALAVLSLAIRRDRVLGAALGAAVVAGVLAPAVASAGMAARYESAFDTPFEPAQAASAIDQLPVAAAAEAKTAVRLQDIQFGSPYLLVTQTAALASFIAQSTSLEVLPIGGFTGAAPSPTLAQLQADIQAGKFRLVLGLARTTDPRMRWIASHCQAVPLVSPALRYYSCARAAVSSQQPVRAG